MKGAQLFLPYDESSLAISKFSAFWCFISVATTSDTSSSFTLVFLPIVETFIPKTILETTVKLNGSNYLLWAQAFRVFISAQNKLTHILQPLPAAADLSYVT